MIESRPAVNSLFTFESYWRAFTPNLLPGSASLRTVYDTTTLRLALLAERPPPPRLVVMLLLTWLPRLGHRCLYLFNIFLFLVCLNEKIKNTFTAFPIAVFENFNIEQLIKYNFTYNQSL